VDDGSGRVGWWKCLGMREMGAWEWCHSSCDY
jgi:hypothetical protein